LTRQTSRTERQGAGRDYGRTSLRNAVLMPLRTETVIEGPMTDEGQAQPPHITQDPASWQAGYNAGMSGQNPQTCPPEVPDSLAFWSGVIEGKAARARAAELQAKGRGGDP
jgi:ribosome modulation factor